MRGAGIGLVVAGLGLLLVARAAAQLPAAAPSPDVSLVGHATDAFTGTPITAFALTPKALDGESTLGKPRSFNNPEGMYRIEGLPAGELRIEARAKGYAPWQAKVSAPDGGEQTLDIQFVVARKVKLLVIDDFGRPAQATLTFRDAQGLDVPVAAPKGRTAMVARADGQGETLVEGLPATKLTVRVQPEPPFLQQTFALDLRNERQGVIELPLRSPQVTKLRVIVLGAPPDAPAPPSGADIDAWLKALPAHFAAGAAWPIERDIRVRVLDADGKMVDAATLDPLVSEEDMKPTLELLPQATRPILVQLSPPRAAAVTLAVQAPGYEPATLALVWPEHGHELEVLVLLHQPAGALEPR